MPFSQVRIDTLQCGEDKLITVDKQVVKVLQKGDQIKFHNNLDNNVDALIRFYPLDSKGDGEIGGFCTEMTGLTLEVPGTGVPTVCTTDADGSFAYEIEAAPTHKPLDPVIIIDPFMSMKMPMHDMPDGAGAEVGLLGGASLMAIAAPLFFGGIIGMVVGKKLL